MSLDFYTIDDFDLDDKTVIVRVDINSPVDPVTGLILDDTRIRLHAETIGELSNRGAKTVVIAHQSRPGKKDFTTMEQHAETLSKIINRKVKYVEDIFGSNARDSIKKMERSDIILLENVRFYSEEILKREPKLQSETHFIQKLSPLADYFINDAFAAAHQITTFLWWDLLFYVTVGRWWRVMERELKAILQCNGQCQKAMCICIGWCESR